MLLSTRTMKIRIFRQVLPKSLLSELARALKGYPPARYDSTFWYPFADRKQELLAEELVARLIRLVRPGRECTGAEWWFRSSPATHLKRLHFDRDEGRYFTTGKIVHPMIASIFYLSAGGPTLILDQRVTPDEKNMVPPEAQRGVITRAVPNSFVIFPGDLRHGVIPDPAGSTASRTTLLVNWWGMRPKWASPPPPDVRAALALSRPLKRGAQPVRKGRATNVTLKDLRRWGLSQVVHEKEYHGASDRGT